MSLAQGAIIHRLHGAIALCEADVPASASTLSRIFYPTRITSRSRNRRINGSRWRTPTNPSSIRIPGNWRRKSTGCAAIPAAGIITKSPYSGDSWSVWTADSQCEPVMNRTRGRTAWSGNILPTDAETTSAVEDRPVQPIGSI